MFDLACALKNDHEVAVACGGESLELSKRLSEQNIKVLPLANLKRSVNILRDFSAAVEIFRLIKKERPQIVHLSSSKAGALGSIAAKLAGTKRVVYTMHGLVLAEPLGAAVWSFYWLAEKISSYFRDAIIAVSDFDRNLAIRYRICRPGKITVVHNGMDSAKLVFLPREQARIKLAGLAKIDLKDKPVIVTVADFYPNKGLAFLVEAARKVLKKIPAAVFIVIGRIGPDYGKIKQAVVQNRLEANFFLLTGLAEAAHYLKAADLFVLPSLKEGFPYALLEAQLSGLPIVATKVGGIPEIITDRENGLLVPPARPESLARGIEELLSGPELAQKLGQKAIAGAGRFSLEKMIEQTKKVYFEK